MLAADPTTAPVSAPVSAVTYGWTNKSPPPARLPLSYYVLKGLPVSAISCAQALASLGLQTSDDDLTYLTATWDTGLQDQAAKVICVVIDDNVGYFDESDLGGAQTRRNIISTILSRFCLLSPIECSKLHCKYCKRLQMLRCPDLEIALHFEPGISKSGFSSSDQGFKATHNGKNA